jgi:hypothetical protein
VIHPAIVFYSSGPNRQVSTQAVRSSTAGKAAGPGRAVAGKTKGSGAAGTAAGGAALLGLGTSGDISEEPSWAKAAVQVW